MIKYRPDVTVRSRLLCSLAKNKEPTNDDIKQEMLVLNEVVVDRGPSAALSSLDLYMNDRYITTVQVKYLHIYGQDL